MSRNAGDCAKLHKPAKWKDASIYRHGRVQLDQSFRKTRRIILDQKVIAEIRNSFFSITPQIQEHFQLELKGLQAIQFLQYRPGDYFHTHADECEPASDSSRKISLFFTKFRKL